MAYTAWLSHWRNLISKIRLVQTEISLQEELQALGSETSPHVLAFVNAHAMNSAAESLAFYQALVSADTLYRDGIGMKLMYGLLAIPPGLNLNGTDLIPRLIAQFDGQVISLYGTREPYLGQAAKTLADKLAPSSPLHCAHGFMQVQDYVDLARNQQPRLIILGMGMPKQEQVAAELRQHLSGACLIVCGGAILDFLGNKVNRAPSWLRKAGLEWVYRLAVEPKRLFKRYVQGNPVFLGRSVRYMLAQK